MQTVGVKPAVCCIFAQQTVLTTKMKISNRAEIMPSSPIRKLSGIAQKIKAEGVKVYHLNIGQPDLPSPQI